MELEKSYINNQFGIGYDIYNISSKKEIEIFFKEAIELTIKNRDLKIGNKIKLTLLFEDKDINICKIKIQEDMEKVFEFMCNKDNFTCIGSNLHFCKKNEFKIKVEWAKLFLK